MNSLFLHAPGFINIFCTYKQNWKYACKHLCYIILVQIENVPVSATCTLV